MDDTPKDPPQKPPPLPAQLRLVRETRLQLEVERLNAELNHERNLVEILRHQLKFQDDPRQEDTEPGLGSKLRQRQDTDPGADDWRLTDPIVPGTQEAQASSALAPLVDDQPQRDWRSWMAARARKAAVLLAVLLVCLGAERLGSRYPGLVDQLKPIVALLKQAAEVIP